MKRPVPAYAMIPMLGGECTVVFYLQASPAGCGQMSGSHRGYDIEALLEQYVGSSIPVIDMRTATTYRFGRFCCDTTAMHSGSNPKDYWTLPEHVEHYRSLGATIYYLTDSSVLRGILEVPDGLVA